ncbi:UNVERIFIED_CONTAM: hypothetical protein FKN15_068654 [Acipenser sinensis]
MSSYVQQQLKYCRYSVVHITIHIPPVAHSIILIFIEHFDTASFLTALKKLAKASGGHFHCYSSDRQVISLTSSLHSENKGTFACLQRDNPLSNTGIQRPAMNDLTYSSCDVHFLWRESQRAVALQNKIKGMCPGMMGDALISVMQEVIILVDVSVTNSMYIIHIQHSLRLLL